MSTQDFVGHIAGVGSASGVRVVVGLWHTSPWGPFHDAMVETASGHRVLLAPTADVAEFVASTYFFDEVRIEPHEVALTARHGHWASASLDLSWRLGRRTVPGRLARRTPTTVARSEVVARALNPVVSRLLPGVRTHGTAQSGRVEWYVARDQHVITSLWGSFDGEPLGALRRVEPPVAFGFSSCPATPCLTSVISRVRQG